ncbi:MAG: EamA family transporter [Gammaproteobacteria bacterium]|nr:EamA family transporter [Gammaproteobacteria bacterium]
MSFGGGKFLFKSMSKQSQSVLFILLSVGLFSTTSLMAKALGTNALGTALHPAQISTARFWFAALVLIPVFYFGNSNFGHVPWGLHIRRSLLGWMGISCLFAAATLIPLADAYAVSFLSVIITMALSVFFLGEKVGLKRWSAALISLVGAVIVARPGTSAFQPAALLALLSAVFIGAEAILVKTLSDREKPIRILTINNVIGASISTLVVPFFWIAPTGSQWPVMIAIGVVMMLAQYCNIEAMKRSDASFVTPFWYGAPVFAAVYDYLLFKQVVSSWSVVGITLIILGGIVIAYRERLVKQSVDR